MDEETLKLLSIGFNFDVTKAKLFLNNKFRIFKGTPDEHGRDDKWICRNFHVNDGDLETWGWYECSTCREEPYTYIHSKMSKSTIVRKAQIKRLELLIAAYNVEKPLDKDLYEIEEVVGQLIRLLKLESPHLV